MAHRVPITVRSEAFEGPLDLLLYLIQSHELDISRISLTEITDQYLDYVLLMQELNFDIASEFLVMAATLLYWKSKALLPQDAAAAATDADEIPLTPEELIRQLQEHQRFLDAGQALLQLPVLGESVFRRAGKRPPIERLWREMEISDLALAFQDILLRERRRKTVLRKETVSLSAKIREFATRLTPGQMTRLRSLLSEQPTRPEEVVTFLASLELARLRKMRLHQEGTYTEIYVELLESLQHFDPQLLTGFEAAADAANPPGTEPATAGGSGLV